ncbi:hypothetical protein FACS1894158_08210 [Betaproteobacteria bacterium]|nr:hypothetical protein FACS1894158_08210 [Betaproteobacteria bacterium]
MSRKFFPDTPDNTSRQRLAWGLFWRLMTAQSGALLFAAAAICFFAFNWTEISAFAKFGLVAALMAAFSAPAALRGFSSSSAHLGLLVCGILGGVLFAVFGQVYQTGADAWELFRAWTFLLIPLFLISRRAGLCFTLWLVATLWAGMYWRDFLDRSVSIQFAFICAEMAVLVVFEVAARFYPGKALPFLRARWIPRCFGFVFFCILNVFLAEYILSRWHDDAMRAGFVLLYIFLMTAGGFWYIRMRRDLFMIASGLLSLIFLIMCQLVRLMKPQGFYASELLPWFFLFIALVALSAGAGKLLIHLHRQSPPPESGTEEDARTLPSDTVEPDTANQNPGLPSMMSWQVVRFALQGVTGESVSSGTEESSPWVARVLMGLCAWISVPLFWLFMTTLILLTGSDPRSAAIVIAFLLMFGGILFSRAPGVFTRQAVLCTTLTAAITLSIAIPLNWLDWKDDSFFLVPGIFVFACSAPWVRNEAYRFMAAVCVVVLTFIWLDLYVMGMVLDGAMGSSRVPGLRVPGLGVEFLFAAVSSLIGAALACLWESPREALLKIRWLGRGGIVALMILGALPLFYRQIMMAGALQHLGFGTFMIGVGASVGLLVLTWRLSVELSFSRLVRTAAFALCLIVAFISYWIPWLGVGIFALALTRYAVSLPLFGFSVAYLFFCVFMEYYDQVTTLLQKSESLAITALFFALTAYLLHFFLARALRNGLLTLPEELAAFCAAPRAKGRFSREDTRLRAALGVFLAVFAALFINAVREKENLLENGTLVLLELAPRDPRSLMQGDYMTLAFSVEREIREIHRVDRDDRDHRAAKRSSAHPQDKGIAVIEPDEQGVYRFVSLYDPAVQLTGKQIRIVYRWDGRRSPRISSGSFFFQEGHGEDYEAARYGDLRVDEEGNSLIVRLRDSSLEVIEPGSGDR